MKKYLILIALLILSVSGVQAVYVYDSSTDLPANFTFYDAAPTYFRANISTLPVHANSATWIGKLVTKASTIAPYYVSYVYVSAPHRYNIVTNSTPDYPISTWLRGSPYIHDYVDYPLQNRTGQSCQDSRYTVVDGKYICTGENNVWIVNPYSKTYYEVYDSYMLASSWGTTPDIFKWSATQGRMYTNTNYTLYNTYSSSQYGNAIFPLLLTKRDLTQSGEIDHPMVGLVPWCLPEKIWPARVAGAGTISTGSVPSGAWLRLKSSFDINAYTTNEYTRKLLRGLKTHGMIITDNSGSTHGEIGLWGESGIITYLGSSTLPVSLEASDFEIIDPTNMIISQDTMLIKSTYFDTAPKPEDPYFPTDPYAGYVPSNLSGIMPVTVQFTDISYDNPNNVTYWIWSFNNVTGNNTWIEFSYDENPLYTFTAAGNYTVNLTAGNAYGYNITPFTAFVNVSANLVTPPDAFFDASPRSGPSPLIVYFNDLSSSTPTSWNWSFGDGNYSNYQDPAHTYNSTGTFDVSLTACNAGGCDVQNRGAYINVNTLVVSNFTTNVTTGFVPLPVAFTDLSTNSPNTWSWNFGDGGWSYLQNPTHTYTTAGTYSVQLTVCNGTDCNTKSGYNITASTVVTDFSGTPLSGTPPLSVQFTDLSTNAPDRWAWQWSNDTGSTWYEFTYTSQKNPIQTFPVAGTYTISMGAGTNMSTWYYKTKYNYIIVSAAPTPTPTTVPPTTVPTTVAPPTTIPTTVPPGTGGSGWSPHMREMAVTTMATIPAQRLDNITEALFGGWNETNQSPDWEPIIINSVSVYTDFLGPTAFLLIFLIPFMMMWLAHGNMKLLSILGIIVGLFVFAYLPANFVAAAIICIVVAGATLIWSIFKQ
jgi:PKD repeat protein